MSNIDRRYAYYDEGVLPEEGGYGVTYLTMYSSDSGNVYDGWMYDPENKITESLTPRTFGYRNPDYPNYCWDDEVVVDLSNAQARQESSEFAQGRITSFNTNVSNRPIVLQDVDITGLTESEREAKATTVLFCAIPLVEDAYIQAEVEVQCKVNLSQDNTTGIVRIEAFYILNDESDRTMRPNPVHTFAVATANERHTLPWLYWNPALKHEDHNYIGVKLICTGGTAEIGISDDPDYGDAIITLTSAGLTGDKIDPGKPVYIELFGLEEVPMNYHFKPSDYTVLCTYDTGEIYDVTNMSAFSMEIGEKFVEPVTLLQATYCGLHASMNVRLGMIDYIEILGLDTFYESYTLDIKDFTVLAYLDSGDIYDITAECTFSPAIGTTITANTTLTATFIDDHSSTVLTFTDSMDIEKIEEIMVSENISNGLIYTLYNDRCIRITGNATHTEEGGLNIHEVVEVPADIIAYLQSQNMTGVLVWDAEGEIGGIRVTGSDITTISGFKDVVVKPYYIYSSSPLDYNPIIICFNDNPYITPYMLEFLLNVEYDSGRLPNVPISVGTTVSSTNRRSLRYAFYNCTSLQDLRFLKNLDLSNTNDVVSMFEGCTLLSDITGIKGMRLSHECTDYTNMFKGCSSLTSARDVSLWDMSYAENLTGMFSYTGLKNLVGIGEWENIGRNSSANSVIVNSMFAYSDIDDLIGLHDTFFTGRLNDTSYMFSYCTKLKSLKHGSGERVFDMSNVNVTAYMFKGCSQLEDLSDAADWQVSMITNATGMFEDCSRLSESSTIRYLTRWEPNACSWFQKMFGISEIKVITNTEASAQLYWPNATLDKNTLFTRYTLSGHNCIRVRRVNSSSYAQYGLPDPEPGYWYYYTSGMFGGYDIIEMKLKSMPYPYPTRGYFEVDHIRGFINWNFLPTFYENAMELTLYQDGVYNDDV